MRAAAVGGLAYHAGKRVQEGRDEDAMAEDYGPPQDAPGETL